MCVEVTVREAMDCVDIVHYRLCMYHRLGHRLKKDEHCHRLPSYMHVTIRT